MASQVRVLVIQHEDDCPVGMIEPWLEEAGVGVDILRAHDGQAVPATLTEHDGLVVLGGEMGAQDDAQHHWLAPTRALIASTVAAGLPFLGVCLGHQLGAVALGGAVRRNPRGPLHRLAPLRLTDEGRTDPLTAHTSADTTVLHWNNDVVVELPPGATLLAEAPDGSVQAARFGPRGWGVQFHPEVDPDIVAGWSPGADRDAELVQIEEFRRRETELHRAWARLVRRFGRVVTGG
ncbi:type 1 glutamine amidotransferase [Ornithinimicrobium tianjinense]|uniref:Aminotransferase n=1 Tax=Ornithinimicrobium tianjinense TaxID=1195761 RepID=A0A917BVW2_9MICO|nr:type 1 glutamine amidotransferase [Ornithinimicrobium tianjinense]GGF59498.1 aminotransferase [Ornithinimicrobium tianjinense]